ncbi:MAG: exodeoxyribonuclease-3, partial [Cellvibrionaceae bacterium]
KLKDAAYKLPPNSDFIWIGSNKHKGLVVLAFNGFKVKLADCYDPKLRFIAPVEIYKPGSTSADFHLLAAWAMHANDGIRKKAMAGPLRDSLDIHADFLTAKPSIAAGDFNNNVFWDKPGWAMNFEDTVARFDELGMISAYHAQMDEAQGDESIPTHYWRDRKKDGPTYHIDFIFVPKEWESAITHFEVGTFEDWCGSKLSDHVPLSVDLQI